ncbi:MAG: hypothetical protein QNJ41_08860 [Xenococcaceae cyanobacterium MO_188.B32]|nr:hypothetical protein [Xenococcaceae cyanobacterium MO_188.B32]
MGKSKNKFKATWKNQKEIGLIYGKSAIAVGKALVELGLKDSSTKNPTTLALSEEIAKSTPLKDGTPFYLWHKTKTCEKLDSLDGWSRQSQEERDLQRLTSEYISWTKKALKANDDGEHHVIVDGLYDEAQSYAKQIKKRGADFIEKANERIAKAKLEKEYLIKE